MKKLVIFVAALTMTALLAACGSSNGTQEGTGTTSSGTVEVNETQTTEAEETTEAQEETTEAQEETTGTEETAVQAEEGLADIISAIYEVKDPGLALMTTDIDLTDAESLSYYTGLTDASQISGASVSEAMISSQAYSLVLVQVVNEADATAVAQEIMANVDTGKWICVFANDTSAAVSGDLVLYVMMDESFEDLSAADLTDAFISLYGGNVVTN